MSIRRGSIDRTETFDEFLAGEGLLAETEETALKQIIADQVRAAMAAEGLTKTAMAARMQTTVANLIVEDAGSASQLADRSAETAN